MKEFETKHIPQNTPGGGDISTESFASLSPAELAGAFEEVLDAMTEDNYDPELLDAYLDALDEKAPMPQAPDMEGSLAQFREKLVSTVPEQTRPAPAHKGKRRPLRRLAVTVAAAMGVLFALMIGAQAAGLDVFGSLARWTDEQFWLVPSSGEGTSEYHQIFQDALAAQELPVELAPSWYPEGFVAGAPEFWDSDFATTAQLTFRNAEDGRTFSFSVDQYKSPEWAAWSYEKDASPVETYVTHERTFYIFSNVKAMTAVCQDENISISLIGNLSVEEIKGIIDSI